MTDIKESEKKSPEIASHDTSGEGISYVSLVGDPYGFTNIEIAEAQSTLDPLNLEEPTDDNEDGDEASFDDASADDEDTEDSDPEISTENDSDDDLNDDDSDSDDEESSPILMSDLRAQAEADARKSMEALEAFEFDTEEFTAVEDNGTLARLAGAISEQTDKDVLEAAEIVAQAAAALSDWTPDAGKPLSTEARAAIESARTLATQIAEDEALQAHLAQEADEAAQIDPELAAALPQQAEDGSLDLNELASCMEAILFMVDKPLSMDRLREMIGPDFEVNLYQEAMSALMDRYKSTAHGIEMVQVANGYQFRTKPGRAALAKKLSKVQTQRLSSGAMESLAIVAYRQPVLKDDIDKIRGVDSSYFIRQLLDKKLIKITGRSEMVGRPLLYGTTDEYLSLFGLKELSAMPSLREIEQMIPSSQTQNPEDEDPRVKEMRKLVGQMKSDTSVTLIYDAREDEKILKEIREKVNAIPTSTPYLDQQRDLEKQAAANGITVAELQARAAIIAAPEGTTAELPLEPGPSFS